MSELTRTFTETFTEDGGEHRWSVSGAVGSTDLVTKQGFLDGLYYHSRRPMPGGVYVERCLSVGGGECWGDVAGREPTHAAFDATGEGDEAVYAVLEKAYVAEFGGAA